MELMLFLLIFRVGEMPITDMTPGEVMTVAFGSTLQPPLELAGRSHYVLPIRVSEGVVIPWRPQDPSKKLFLAYGKWCSKIEAYGDGSLLLAEETPEQFVDRNRYFKSTNRQAADNARDCIGPLEIPLGGGTDKGLESPERLSRHLLIYAEYLRKYDNDPARWRRFFLASLEQEQQSLEKHALNRDVSTLADSIKYFDKSTRSDFLTSFKPQGEVERTAMVDYLTFMVRARRKVLVFSPDGQEVVRRDETLLASMRRKVSAR